MGKVTGISWTHHSFNTHHGCTEPLIEIGGKQVMAPECVRCYARTFSKRCGFDIWGDDKPRRFFSDKHWDAPLQWNREAEASGEQKRVFCISMGDILENRRDLDPLRERLRELVARTPWLAWMILTKRADNFETLMPASFWMLPNVWAGVTAGVQESADLRIPYLLALKQRYPHLIAWLSMEPLLGPVDLWGPRYRVGGAMMSAFAWGKGIDLAIVGGESGNGARPMELPWVHDIQDSCVAAETCAFYMKQLGGVKDKRDKIEDFPARLQVQEMPAMMVAA